MSGKEAVNAELPTGWLAASFSEVAKARMGPTILAKDLSESGLPVYSAGKANTAWGFTKRDVPVFSNGTIVVSARGSIGFPKIPKEPSFTSTQTTIAITPSPAIGSTYLQRFLQSSDWAEMSSGAAIPMLTISMLGELAVLLAPLAEQKRIVDKLEAVLGRVDACRARLNRVPALLKRFRQSVLAAATSGRLTEVWRTSRKLAPWPRRQLGNICESDRIITYGVIKLGDETFKGVPCLRTSNVRWLNIDTTGIKRIEKSLSNDYSRTILRGGEVLVNVRGTLGGVAVAEQEMAGWNVSREVAVVPLDQNILSPKFLAFWIGAESSQAWLTGVQKGVAYTGINIEDLRLLPIGIPTSAEQQEIVRRVEDVFAFATRIEARLATAQKTVERLTPATLAKAFRGELVPQDPNDEPASVLLERLTDQKATTPIKRTRRNY